MNSNRIAVFAASLQWTDAVKVVSRGTPRSRASVTWGIRWSVSAAEKDGEMGGRFPTMKHFLGLIGKNVVAVPQLLLPKRDRVSYKSTE